MRFDHCHGFISLKKQQLQVGLTKWQKQITKKICGTSNCQSHTFIKPLSKMAEDGGGGGGGFPKIKGGV